MKLIALIGAGALAAGTMVAAAPADAQHYGYGHEHGRSHHRDGGRYHDRRGYGTGRVYHRRGYGYGQRYRRGRLVCRVHRGYHGPVRRCFRLYR